MKFIYVFSEQDKLKLESIGYDLLKSDDRSGVYIFTLGDDAKASDIMCFDASLDKYYLSNVLTF